MTPRRLFFLGGRTHCDLALFSRCSLPEWQDRRRNPLKERALDHGRGARRLGLREGGFREQHGLAHTAAVIPAAKALSCAAAAHAEHIGVGARAANLMGLNGVELDVADGADSPVEVHAHRM
jgi:hypothetical protein